MAYRNRNSFIKNISSIGKSYSGLLGGVSFIPSDYGYRGSDLYSGRYCKYGTSCLGGKWGAERYDTDYKYDGSPVPFAKAYLCPIPKRKGTIPVYSTGSSDWGNKGLRVQDTPYYIRYDSNNKYLYGGTSSNPTSRIGYGPIIIIDIVGGGGAGGSTFGTSASLGSGAGGGGGGYWNLVLDLRATGLITIKVGNGGFRYKSGTPYKGDNGSASTVSTSNGLVFTAGGGKGGINGNGEFYGTEEFRAEGGPTSATLNNSDATDSDLYNYGVLYKQRYNGKYGGYNKYISTSTHVEGDPGGSFISTDVISNYGIVDNTSVFEAGGSGSSCLPTNTSYNRSVVGGGGGASVLMDGGRLNWETTSDHIGGGGGDGGRAVSGWWIGQEEHMNGYCGADGCAVLHYATNL